MCLLAKKLRLECSVHSTGPINGSRFSTQITLSVVIGAAKSATTADSRGPPTATLFKIPPYLLSYFILFCYLVKLVPPCPLRMVEVTLVQHSHTFWSMVNYSDSKDAVFITSMTSSAINLFYCNSIM